MGAVDPTELEHARPQTAVVQPLTKGEEELQLQLALAMSREEAEQEANKSKSDDMRLQLALQKSKEEAGGPESASENDGLTRASGLSLGGKPSNDLLDLDFGNPVAQPPPPQRTAASASSSSVDPWGMPLQQQSQQPQLDPWGEAGASSASAVPTATVNDPWSPVKEPPRTSPLPNLGGPQQPNTMVTNDPWSPIPAGGQADKVLGNNEAWGGPSEAAILASNNNDPSIDPFSPVAQKELNEFDLLRNEIEAGGNKNNGGTSPNPFDLAEMGSTLNSGPSPAMGHSTGAKPKKSVHSLLGEHSNLVNLDNLVTDSKNNVRNPFEQHPNPFQAAKSPKPAMNQLLQQQSTPWQQPPQQQQKEDFNPFF